LTYTIGKLFGKIMYRLLIFVNSETLLNCFRSIVDDISAPNTNNGSTIAVWTSIVAAFAALIAAISIKMYFNARVFKMTSSPHLRQFTFKKYKFYIFCN
jgi:hypothetical protein